MRYHAWRTATARALGAAALISLAACGGGSGSTPFIPMAVPAPSPASPAPAPTPTPTPSVGYRISGTVSGLSPNAQLTLVNNGTDAVSVKANGGFTFPSAVAQNASYSVTVSAQPDAQSCAVSGGSGSGVSADVTGVSIDCVFRGFTSTLAGSKIPGSANGTGAAAQFNGPFRAAVDSNGTVYVSDYENHMIRKITPAGVVTTLAGSTTSGRANGLGSAASFFHPIGVAVDSRGYVYVADSENNLIRRISPDGLVSTLAGSGSPGSADGTGSAASFLQPGGLAMDDSDNLYVADSGNHRIRMITPAGVVTTLAGNGPGWADGTGSAASFRYPQGLALDGSGNLYVSDRDNNLIRKLTPNGVVTTLAGDRSSGSKNGTGAAASFNKPFDVTADSSGNAYIADGDNHMVRKMTPAGVVTTLAGSTTSGNADGAGTAASFKRPMGIAIDGNGVLYVADFENNMIRKIVP